MSERFPSLDGLRGFAALWVMGLHAFNLAPPRSLRESGPLVEPVLIAMQWGWSGVHVFFVLSGFLLSLPFALAATRGEAGMAYRPYAMRRLARICPGYWMQCLQIALLLLALGSVPAVPASASAAQLPQQALMLFNLYPESPRPWLPVWWTLPVEMGFYLLLPVLALQFGRRGVWLLLLLVLASMLVRVGMTTGLVTRPWAVVLGNQLPSRLDVFLCGSLAALLWVRRRGQFGGSWGVRGLQYLGILLAVSVIAWVVLARLPRPLLIPANLGLVAWQTLFAAAVATAVLGMAAGDRLGIRSWWALTPLRHFGKVSFGLYLWHLPVLAAMRPLATLLPEGGLRPIAFFLLGLPLAWLLAWLSWRWVERPAQLWVRRRWPYNSATSGA